MNVINMVGERYGRLTVISQAPSIREKNGHTRIMWNCQCDCGNTIVCPRGNLIKGNTRSCGCIKKEQASQRKTTHGKSNTRLFRIHNSMKGRCLNPNNKAYANYGGRGITICPEWLDFQTFYDWAIANGYKEDLTIERKDVNGNYCSDNCTWITKAEQSRNRRNVHFIDYNGKTYTLTELSKEFSIGRKNFMTYEKRFGSSQKALEYIFKRREQYGRCERMVSYKGEIYPLKQLCGERKLCQRSVECRIDNYGWTVERAIDEPMKQKVEITFNGETHTLREWSEITGIPYHTLRGRLYGGCSVEKTLTAPYEKESED